MEEFDDWKDKSKSWVPVGRGGTTGRRRDQESLSTWVRRREGLLTVEDRVRRTIEQGRRVPLTRSESQTD